MASYAIANKIIVIIAKFKGICHFAFQWVIKWPPRRCEPIKLLLWHLGLFVYGWTALQKQGYQQEQKGSKMGRRRPASVIRNNKSKSPEMTAGC